MKFETRKSVHEIEEGNKLQPKFDGSGLIPVITTDYKSGLVLMHSYMNHEALSKTIETGLAHYWSRSRKTLWKKGQTSGLYQNIKEIKIDDDQDCLWISVDIKGNGASCHVGFKSCFYRKITYANNFVELKFTEKKKIFDPKQVYGDAPNPTKI